MKALLWNSIRLVVKLGRIGQISFAVLFAFLLGQLVRELVIFVVHWTLRHWQQYLALFSC
ncbi:MAG TPA: hypothetical protein VE860_20770 [Chthoniobacterales bacterium]|nr:hypothetical protein [Chthoniobacterales bacterium]